MTFVTFHDRAARHKIGEGAQAHVLDVSWTTGCGWQIAEKVPRCLESNMSDMFYDLYENLWKNIDRIYVHILLYFILQGSTFR